MARTKKQQKGDYGESVAIIEDLGNDYEDKTEKKNNKGYDHKRRKINYSKLAGGIE